MREKKTVSMKVAVLLLVAVLLIGCTVGGTLAWLIATTNTVTNTFVAGDVGDLTLEENSGESYTVVPGVNITKNPVVTFTGNNIPAYVFVKVEADEWTVTGSGTEYTYTMGTNSEMSWILEGWTKLSDGVYYKEVAANANGAWHLIKDDTVTVSSAITKDTIANFESSLSFTAYAIQQEGFASPAAAWAAASAPATP